MTRQRSQKATESDSKVKAALISLSTGKYRTPYAAAKALDLSVDKLYRHMKGGKSRAESREKQQNLTRAEEKALEGWIIRLTATGHPARYSFIREMAEEIRKQRDDSTLCSYSAIGISWVQQFIKRFPHLKTTMSHSIEATRIKDVTRDIIVDWFTKLDATIEENQITLENTYNMDETGTTSLYYEC